MIRVVYFILIVFLSFELYAQNKGEVKLLDNKKGLYTWEALNLRIDTTATIVSFVGSIPKTKDVSKDSGGTKAISYMRVWNTRVFPTDFPAVPEFYWMCPNVSGYVNAWGEESIFSTTGDYDPQFVIWFDSLLFNSYKFADSVRIQLKFFRRNPFSGSGITITFAGFAPNLTFQVNGGSDMWETVDTTVSSPYFDDSNDYTNLTMSVGMCDTFYVSNLTFTLSGNDSSKGYFYPTERFTDTTTYYYSQSVKWTQRDEDIIWLAAENDTVTIYPYIAPIEEDGLYTSDGNEIYTSDGNRLFAKP